MEGLAFNFSTTKILFLYNKLNVYEKKDPYHSSDGSDSGRSIDSTLSDLSQKLSRYVSSLKPLENLIFLNYSFFPCNILILFQSHLNICSSFANVVLPVSSSAFRPKDRDVR